MDNLGYILKILRISNELGTKELSEKLGYSQNYICEIEAHKKNVTLRVLGKYSEVLHISTSKIFEIQEQTRNSNSLYQEALLLFLKYYLYEKDGLEEDSSNYIDSDIKQSTKNRNL